MIWGCELLEQEERKIVDGPQEVRRACQDDYNWRWSKERQPLQRKHRRVVAGICCVSATRCAPGQGGLGLALGTVAEASQSVPSTGVGQEPTQRKPRRRSVAGIKIRALIPATTTQNAGLGHSPILVAGRSSPPGTGVLSSLLGPLALPRFTVVCVGAGRSASREL